MRSKWQMICPLPETPVSLNASLSQPGTSMYGFMVKPSPLHNLDDVVQYKIITEKANFVIKIL